MKARLRTRLIAAVVLYVLLLAGVGWLGLSAAQSSLDGMHAAIQHHVREVAIVGEVAREASSIQATSIHHIATDDDAERERYERQLTRATNEVNTLVEELEQTQVRFDDEGDIPPIEDFRQAWREFVRIRDQEVLPLSRQERDVDALALTEPNGAFAQAYREVRLRLGVLQRQLADESTQRLQDAERDFGWNRQVLFVVVVVAAVVGIAFGLWQSARLARAIESLSAAARHVASGDLTRRVRIDSGDELQSLAESFNVMTERIDAQLRALEAEVTERRRIEAALRDSEARFRSVTESVIDAIVSTDATGNVIFWNRGAQAIFGYSEAEMLGQSLTRLLPERHRDAFQSGFDHADEPELVGRTVEVFGRRKDGTEVPVEVSTAAWTHGDERLYTATIRDITERRAVERMKNEFVSMVSHELRTPLSGIIGMTDLLLRRDLDAQGREYAEAVRQSGDSLMAIINDILDFSKIEAGKFELETGPLDVRGVVEDVTSLLAEQAQAKGLEIACVVDPGLPDCLGGDASRLRQILLNLVGNAIKFTHTGNVVVRAAPIERNSHSLVVRFEVEDSGVGIPREARGRLFEAFAQADSSTTRQYGGTGLGLTISKRLAELMGGQVGAESAPQRGSTFWFTARFARYGNVTPTPVAPVRLEGQRVLIVGHNATTPALLQQQLAARGLIAEAAEDSEAALERLRARAAAESPFTFVLLDEDVAAGSLGLTRAIKADPLLEMTRVVLLTRIGDVGYTEERRSAGVAAVLEKPVRELRLLDCLARALEGAACESEAGSAPLPRSVSAPALTGAARILLVEDTPLNQRVAAGMLRELGYAVDVAASGRQALKALERQHADRQYALVLMDCQMPEMDGFQTTTEIRRREAGRDPVPIIAMTASAMPGDRERCVAAGMNDYLPKPVTLDRLAQMIHRWLPSEPPGASVAASADAASVDERQASYLEQLRSRPGGANAVRKLVEQFRADAPVYAAALLKAAREHDPAALHQAAHSLRGSALLVGARDLVDLLAQLERLASRGTTRGAEDILEKLDAALARTDELLVVAPDGGA